MSATAATPKPRCYREFCCNTATVQVVVVDRSFDGKGDPIPWGWCEQHAPVARRFRAVR